MALDIKSVLEGLNKKELIEIANQKKINFPNNWSKSLMVEFLALNVTIDNLQKTLTKPLEPKKNRRVFL